MSIEGQRLENGRYQLSRLLMKNRREIYLAEDNFLNRQVVIKVFFPESVYSAIDNTGWKSRFLLDKAKTLSTFKHPHILALLGYGEEFVNGSMLAYIVMPFRPEGSFAIWLKHSKNLLPLQDVVYFVQEMAAALTYAHYRKIAHLNVKPSNFLIERNPGDVDHPNLLLTNFSIITSTLPVEPSKYTAPEQCRGYSGDAASDLYALGIIAYEMLIGYPPFQGTSEQLKHYHLNAPPQPLSALRPGLSRGIDDVILHALAKSPQDRFSSVSEFAQVFEQAIPTSIVVPGKPKGKDIHATVDIGQDITHPGIIRPLTLSDGRTVDVSIPVHAGNGQMIVLPGQGRPSQVGGPAGDLIVTLRFINVTPNPSTSFLDRLIESVEKSVVALKLKISNSKIRYNLVRGVGTITRTLSHNKESVIWYGILTGFGICILGIILGVLGRLNYLVEDLAIGLGSFIGLSATIWAAIGDVFKSLWHKAKPVPVFSLSAITVVILAAVFLLPPRYTQPPQLPFTDPYTHAGILQVDDSLKDYANPYMWETGTYLMNHQNQGSCSFTRDGYEVEAPAFIAYQYHELDCWLKKSTFKDFVYQIRMKLDNTNTAGGLVFRVDPSNGNALYAGITTGGQFGIYSVSGNGMEPKRLKLGSSRLINIGADKSNMLAVVVEGTKIDLYINGSGEQNKVAEVNDTTHDQGYVGAGVLISTSKNSPNSAQAEFTDAKVWSLDPI